jgi:predicted negative regulator of RcsB-dependent stress response
VLVGICNLNAKIMARHPGSRRVSRPVESSDDAFIAGVLESSVWAKRHSRVLIAGGVALLLLVGGLFWYRSYTTTIRENAAMELTQVRQTVMAGNLPLAIRDLESFIATYDGTPAAREARVLLAQIYLEAGQAQQAASTVERLARDPGAPLGASAAFLLAGAYEAAGHQDRAEQVFLRIADDARFDFERVEALDHAARLRLQRGDAAGAATLYQRVLDMIPEDADRGVFEMRRAEAETRAQAARQPGS